MKYIILSLIFVLMLSVGVSAESINPMIIYDLTDMSTDNYQGHVYLRTGMTHYNMGFELGYLSETGYADKSKKYEEGVAIQFKPISEDGSFCKQKEPCTWEEQTIIINSDYGIKTIYLPAGDGFNVSAIYYYVAEDGSAYHTKSNHLEGPNGAPDLTFEQAAVPEHLARAVPSSAELQKKRFIEDIDLIKSHTGEEVLVRGCLKYACPTLYGASYPKDCRAMLCEKETTECVNLRFDDSTQHIRELFDEDYEKSSSECVEIELKGVSDDINFIVVELDPNGFEPTACTEDAMVCPEGTAVGRTGPNCEFVCPEIKESEDSEEKSKNTSLIAILAVFAVLAILFLVKKQYNNK